MGMVRKKKRKKKKQWDYSDRQAGRWGGSLSEIVCKWFQQNMVTPTVHGWGQQWLVCFWIPWAFLKRMWLLGDHGDSLPSSALGEQSPVRVAGRSGNFQLRMKAPSLTKNRALNSSLKASTPNSKMKLILILVESPNLRSSEATRWKRSKPKQVPSLKGFCRLYPVPDKTHPKSQFYILSNIFYIWNAT